MWGPGTPRREFLHVDDLADAVVFLTENYSREEHINIGAGEDLSIRDLARLVCDIVGFRGEIEFHASKPDGTPLKCSDVSRLRDLGWFPAIDLRTGLGKTYHWYLENAGHLCG